MQARWLITGAQGFVGRYLSHLVLLSDPAAMVVGLGRSERLDGYFSHQVTGPKGPTRAPLPPAILASEDERYHYCRCDLADNERLQAILDKFRPEKVIHLASGLRGDRRRDLIDNNIAGTASLLEAAAKVDGYLPKVVLGSTGGVYGEVGPSSLPLNETLPCESVDEYSVTKLAAELLARLIANRKGIKLVIARMFNLVGAGQDERHVAGRIAAELIQQRSQEVADLKLGSLTSTRDFIDVRDAVRALYLLTNRSAEGVFNVGTGRECSIAELLNESIAVYGNEVCIQNNADGRRDIPRHFADISRLRQIGFEPFYSLRSSVESIWDYYLQLWCT
ncbi:MAG: NAD-dependent epimerase/dehydratase family protein [Acidobacteriota bacterium]|nr:NAD-dependent epimerase/dehydratase family protein [Acidobacteriota bacterium]